MAISVILTFNSTAYDVSDYVVKDSIEMDESLFTDLSPNTSACKFKLSRSCPYLDEIFEWSDSIQIAITSNGIVAFTGFLTDDPEMAVSPTGIGDVEISAEDSGIKLLKRAWTSTDGLATVFNGRVCDASTPSTSFLHILAALAGVTLSSTLPTISGTVDFSVADTDEDEYWDILEGVLSECLYTFYFNAAGELCLYALSGMQGAPTDYVTTQGTILSEGGTKPGIIVKKRRYNYREITVEFDETETVASEIVFKDTTNQSATHDCVISLSPGEYYPPTCDASTYAYIDYFLEDKRDIVSVASAASDFICETGIVAEFTHLGKRARVRFYNGAATQKTITQIRVMGTNVVAVSSKSKQICGEAGKAKKKVTAKYIHAKADALALGNLLYYYYKNSASTYEFRSYLGTLYPATTLFPSTSLYPMGDPLSLGEIVRIYDPLWTGLDVNVVITGKQYILGRDGATYTAEGVNTINLGDIGTYVARTPATVPNVQKYPAEKPLTALTDAVDFDGQYGIYGGQRYVGTMPATWALDDAGQTAAQVAAAVPVYVPQYLGAIKDGFPASAKGGDVYLIYSETPNTVDPPTVDNPPDHRGVFRYTSGAWAWTTDPADIEKALYDIVMVCLVRSADGASALYGAEADYGINETIKTAHIKAAIIDMLRVGNLTIYGLLKSAIMDTVAPRTGDTVNAPTPTYWAGSALISHCAGLSNGWTAVDASSTIGGKNITHAVKGGADNSVSYQASDAEVSGGSGIWAVVKSITSAVSGKVRVYVDYYHWGVRLKKNGIYLDQKAWVETYTTAYWDITVVVGDTLELCTWDDDCLVKNFRLCPAPSTIGLWNNTDDTALSINNADYYSVAGNVDITGLANFATADHDTYWKGSELLALLLVGLRAYKTTALGGGTFNGKTCESIYIGVNFLTLSYASGSSDTVYSDNFYNYAGSIILPAVEGKLLIGDETTIGQYEIWPHYVPGSSNLIITIRNTKSTDPHSIWEIRAPDKTTGDSEATLSLHGVVGTDDYVNDKSMHNYSGTMCSLDVFSNFGGSTLGDWKHISKRLLTAWAASTAYALGDTRSNGGNAYICTYAGTSAASGGPTGTDLVISDGTAYWQYLCALTDGMLEQFASSVLVKSNRGWYAGGRKPTGSLHGSYTHAQIFAAIAPCVPNVGDEILATGGYDQYTMVSKIERSLYNRLKIYCMNAAGTPQYFEIYSTFTTTLDISIAW